MVIVCPTRKVLFYNPDSGEIHEDQNIRLITPRRDFVAGRNKDGVIVVAGGYANGKWLKSTEIYDPRLSPPAFRPGPDMNVQRNVAAGSMLGNEFCVVTLVVT